MGIEKHSLVWEPIGGCSEVVGVEGRYLVLKPLNGMWRQGEVPAEGCVSWEGDAPEGEKCYGFGLKRVI